MCEPSAPAASTTWASMPAWDTCECSGSKAYFGIACGYVDTLALRYLSLQSLTHGMRHQRSSDAGTWHEVCMQHLQL
jgi:hypothetical protein